MYQKQSFIPKVVVTHVTNYDATADFTTEYMEFTDSTKDWSVEFTADKTAEVPADSFTIATEGENLTDGVFPGLVMTNGAVVDITVAANVVSVVTLISGGSGYINGGTYSLVLPLAGTPVITQPTFDAVVTTALDSTATILVCNTHDGTYKNYKTASTDVAIATDPIIFDSIMPFRFMKIAYTANTSTGQISINVSK
jgi:hypothetical protein